jgi:hypothetical protein
MTDNTPDDGGKPEDPARPLRTDKTDDYDLDFEEDVAPEENSPWLPHPEPTDGEAPAP